MNRFSWLSVVFVVLHPSGPRRLRNRLRFETHVRPILKAYCFDCHGDGDKLKGGLDLRLRRLIAAGGKTGPLSSRASRTIACCSSASASGEMPPTKKKLSKDEADIIRRWIAAGAKTERPEPTEVAGGMLITDDDRAWWAFQAVKKVSPPPARAEERARTPVDAWLLVRLREKKVGFNPDADRATLLRARHVRPHLPAADAGRDRKLPQRRLDRCL